MSYVQKVRDKFWITIGKPEKVFPARVEKYKQRGDSWKKEYDRGRRYTTPKGDEEYQFMNEQHSADSVPYEYIRETNKGSELSVLMPDRDVFVPFRHSFEKEDETVEIDYDLDQKNWYRWKEKEWRQTSEIVEEDEDSFFEENQTMIVFFAMGLFFLFSFYGYGEYLFSEMSRISENLRLAAEALEGAELPE